jgi:hypothetical protein
VIKIKSKYASFRDKTPFFWEGASAFFLGKICMLLAYFGKRGLKFNTVKLLTSSSK